MMVSLWCPDGVWWPYRGGFGGPWVVLMGSGGPRREFGGSKESLVATVVSL